MSSLRPPNSLGPQERGSEISKHISPPQSKPLKDEQTPSVGTVKHGTAIPVSSQQAARLKGSESLPSAALNIMEEMLAGVAEEISLQRLIESYSLRISTHPPTPKPLDFSKEALFAWVEEHRPKKTQEPDTEPISVIGEKTDIEDTDFEESDLETDFEEPDWEEIDDGYLSDEQEPEYENVYETKWRGSEKCYKAAKAIADNFRVIGFGHFMEQLEKVTHAFNEEMNQLSTDEGYVVIVDPIHQKKSSNWITSHAFPRLDRKPVDIIEASKLTEFLQKHPEIKHVVRFDDAVYTGKQMCRYIENIQETLNPEGKIHLVCPFYTNSGRARIESMGDRSGKCSVSLAGHEFLKAEGSPNRMLSLFQVIKDEDTQNTIMHMYPKAGRWELMGKEQYNGVVLLAFQHKIPDFVSTLRPFIEGYIHDKEGHIKDRSRWRTVKKKWISEFNAIYKMETKKTT